MMYECKKLPKCKSCCTLPQAADGIRLEKWNRIAIIKTRRKDRLRF